MFLRRSVKFVTSAITVLPATIPVLHLPLSMNTLLSKHVLILLTLPVHKINGLQDIAFVSLDDVSVHDHLVQQKVNLLKLIHYVKLAYRPGPAIHRLHEGVYEFQQSQFILVVFDVRLVPLRHRSLRALARRRRFGHLPNVKIGLSPHDEEETRVSTVYHLESPIFEEGALELGTAQALAYDF